MTEPDPRPEPSALAADPSPGYRCRRTFQAPRDQVFAAVATVTGLRQWWTGIVSGSADVGQDLTFGFSGLDERIVMRVDDRRAPELVAWTCVAHSRDNQWTGGTIRFALAEITPLSCTLDFHHGGITPSYVAAGWEHFLDSLAGYVEHGAGHPYGSPPA